MSGATIAWRPSAGIGKARRRAAALERARRFFAGRNVLEVETPVLSGDAVTDRHVDNVGAVLDLQPGSQFYLRTSPEYFMKRLLCAGYPDIYEIGRVFRDGESGRRHQPEFTMVEWYRAGFGLHDMIDETVEFVTAVLDRDLLAGDAHRMTYRGAFEATLGVDPSHAPIETLESLAGPEHGLSQALGNDRDAWLDLLQSVRITPGFPPDRLTVVYHYPASQAALARLCPDDDAVADRFEVFLGGLELANGFVELRDADEQLRRFEADRKARRAAGKPAPGIDQAFIAALRSGLPDCAGVAVGFDRLMMINERCSDIRDVLTFPFRQHDQR